MLIRRAHLDGIRAGVIDLAFRRWTRPTVRAGGTLTTAIGVLAIDGVEVVPARSITAADAERAGFATRAELLAALDARGSGPIHRIELRFAGADPRLALRERSELSADERTELTAKLAGYDARSKHGPWTGPTLEAIRTHPGVRAPDLAADLGFDTPWFKTNVRKLKALGLTESLEVGYRLSPRGRAFVDG